MHEAKAGKLPRMRTDQYELKKVLAGSKDKMDITINDTSKKAEEILINGYRAMSAEKKMKQVSILAMTVQRMALTRIRAHYGAMREKSEKLRLAALWIPRETMIKLLNWDPEIEGY